MANAKQRWITQNDFQFFQKQCKRYVRLFGLREYNFYYEFIPLEDPETIACVKIKGQSAVTVSLNKEYRAALSRKELKDTACHEIVHVALDDLSVCARERFTTKFEIQNANEKTTTRITGVIIELEGNT